MILAAVEGYPDAEVARKVLEHVGLDQVLMLQKRGKSHLDAQLPELNRTARTVRCLVIRDLDRDATCPSQLVARLLPSLSKNLIFRVAVREIEAWLMADRERFAAFFGIPQSRLSMDPDTLDNPKQLLASLAKSSRLRMIREEVPP